MAKSNIPLKAEKLFVLVILLLVSIPVFAQVDTAWVRRYNGLASDDDQARAIAVDSCGNVYVTGYSFSGTDYDYATIRYYPNGDMVWVRTYNGPGNGDDMAYAIAVYGCDNVYVTGASEGSGTYNDYATIKYDSSGNELWVRRYNGPGNDYDGAYAIALDGSGNVYVTGISYGSGTEFDYATIKYYPNGDTAWVRRYNGPGNSDDYARAIALDGSGNVYVTGDSWGSGTKYDYATIKYYPNGGTAWVRRYNGAGNDEDWAYHIAVDGSGNVYVTGVTDYHWESGEKLGDYATIKYYPNGDTAWVRRYNGPGNARDEAWDIAVDGSSNVYVTGGSTASVTSSDYATIKYYPTGDTAWVRRYNGPGNEGDWPYAIALDGSGNVYVTGYSWGSGTEYDYATIKYVQPEESITVVFPNGGETLYVDARYDIAWSWTYVESVKIQCSINGGSSWLPITGSTGSDGSYSWVVPNTPSENCLVKISDAKDGDPVDISDGYFSIICEPMIVVKSPNGRECWRVGTTYDIKWDHFCFHDSVLIEYTTNNGGSWDTIVETTTNDGLYPWTTPDTSSDSCLIRISDVVDHIPSDTSDKLFSIVIWVRGDADGDGLINAADVVYLINYLYIGGPVPLPWAAGDVNSDGTINAADVVYLINYLYIHGPPPAC